MNYEIKSTLEAGIELLGSEVKTIKAHLGSLDGSHVIIRGGEVYLMGSFIPPYQPTNSPKEYDPYRTRRLLIHKDEIMKLLRETDTHTLTIHPISLYNKDNLIKCEIALCKKKNKHDKRETLKKEESDRQTRNIKFASYDYE